MSECEGHRGVVMEFLWRVLGDFDPIGRGTLQFVPWVMVGVSVVAVGLLFCCLMRRWRAGAPVLNFGEDEAQRKSNCDEDAIALFDQTLLHDAHAIGALKGRGLLYSQMGEYDLAMQDFHMWVLREPDNGDAYFHRGDIWQKLDLIGLAISDYRSALKFNPSHEGAHGALAKLMRDSTACGPKTIFSLAALFAAHVPADRSQPSSLEPTASVHESTEGLAVSPNKSLGAEPRRLGPLDELR
jgi:tetratricopeptide (TPR) repeat protein